MGRGLTYVVALLPVVLALVAGLEGRLSRVLGEGDGGHDGDEEESELHSVDEVVGR